MIHRARRFIPGRFAGPLLALASLIAPAPGAAMDQDAPRREKIRVVEWTDIQWDETAPLDEEEGGFVARFAGQIVERTVQLPARMPPQDQMPRIQARLWVEPRYSKRGGTLSPNDPWTRLGNVTVLAQGPDGPAEVELMRFVTGYGARGRFEQDVTDLAPLLFGTRTFRVFLSSFSKEPGWRVSLQLDYFYGEAGYRRPSLVLPLFNDPYVASPDPPRPAVLTRTVDIPRGLSRPRIRILTTGHSTDGAGEHEFVTATHVLRIDGHEVARWRPWCERGAELRPHNDWAFRRNVDGRIIWSSDLDRSGWQPGLAVEPLMIPVAELTPGRHTVELEIQVLPPPPDSPPSHHGYWVVSALVVADDPWPESGGD